jgi:xanthine dehydrogenase YagS FAD-binding subunit
MPMVGFHRLPDDEPERDTMLRHGQLVTAVEVPPLAFAARSAYRKVRERASFSFAVVSVAAALDVEHGHVKDVRIALGGVAHAPWRAVLAEEALRGQPTTHASFARAADTELAHARPLRDNGYKVSLARNLVVRTLHELAEGT